MYIEPLFSNNEKMYSMFYNPDMKQISHFFKKNNLKISSAVIYSLLIAVLKHI